MPKNRSPYIENLDSLGKQGTHWVCCMPSHTKKELWQFDSFGMLYPLEYEMRAKKDDVNVIYNTTPYQDLLSVQCGYYCLYVLHKWTY